MQDLWQRLKGWWAQASGALRVAVVFGGLIVLGTVVWVYIAATAVNYRVLVSGLSPEDTAAVVAKLQTLNIPHKLAAGGSAVLVAAEQVEQARVSLAADGVPTHGGKGWEIFDENSLATPPFVQNVNYLRALQAELARTIQQMEPVATARVHIVHPEPSPFVRDQKNTTASVVLKLKPGANLNRSMAQAIVALVSRGVEGLKPENVAVMDTAGRLLSDKTNEADGIPTTQLEFRRDLENYLAGKAEDLLGKTLGYGRAIIKVAADVDFKRLKERKETFNTDEKFILKEKTSTRKGGSVSGSGGRAGAASNVARGGSSGGAGSTQEEENETEYCPPAKTVSELEDNMSSIKRLTVAAMVDLSAVGDGQQSINVEDIREIIKQAIGCKAEDIKVSNVKLTSPVPPEESNDDAVERARWLHYTEMARNIALGLSAILALVLGFLLMRRLRPAKAPPVPAPAPPMTELLNELAATAQQDPNLVARLLAGMMGP